MTKYKVAWDTKVFEYHERVIELPDGKTPDDLTFSELSGYENPDTMHASEAVARDVTEWEEKAPEADRGISDLAARVMNGPHADAPRVQAGDERWNGE